MTSNIVPQTKRCPKCGETKPVEAFSKHKRSKDGLQPNCKACKAEQHAVWRATNPEYAAAYYAANRERYLEKCAIWAAENKDRKRETNAAWLEANRDRKRATDAAWMEANRDRKRETDAAWYTANKSRANATSSDWAKANPERVRHNQAAWAKANPDRVLEKSAAFRIANPDRVRKATAKWQKANPEAVRIHSQNRRARTEKNGGKLSRGITNLLMSEQAGKCAGCLTDLAVSGHHLDHVVPLALGGSNTDSNMQLLCPSCNSSKNAKHPIDWMAAKGIFTP